MKLVSVDPAYQPLLDDYLAGRVQPDVVKSTKVRLVHRVSRDGRCLYVKRFMDRGLEAKVRSMIADRALHEFKVLEKLANAGVGTARPVAASKGVLVTVEVPDARELRDVFQPSQVRDLARFVRAVHDAGVRDDDLHIGNILVSPVGFHLIDVHRARIKKLTDAERIEGVAFALHSISTLVTPGRALAFVRAYGGDKRFALRVWEAFQRVRETYWADRTGRCLKDGREFAKDGPWHLRRPLTRAEAEVIAGADGRVVKVLKNRRLRVVGPHFVKVHPRALAEWENAHAIEVRHLGTPRLWAARKGVVLGAWHDRAVPLWDHLKAAFPALSRRERNDFLYRLARFVRRLHVRGVFHKDLKANNVLVDGAEFLVIDLDRVAFSRDVALKNRLFNLAQLNAAIGAPLTIGERLRFYRYYAGNNREWRAEWKARVRAIMRTTVARRHHWPLWGQR